MKDHLKKITLIGIALILTMCGFNIENKEVERVNAKLLDLKNEFYCSDASAHLGHKFDFKNDNNYKHITIDLIICDSLKENIDSVKLERLETLSKVAFNAVENKSLFGAYSINVFSDFERTEAVKILNYKYNIKTKDFEYYSSERI